MIELIEPENIIESIQDVPVDPPESADHI